jgi:hypothetical protein
MSRHKSAAVVAVVERRVMGWLERWHEARAEAAVRRQLAALEGCRGIDSHLDPPIIGNAEGNTRQLLAVREVLDKLAEERPSGTFDTDDYLAGFRRAVGIVKAMRLGVDK